MSKYQRPIRNVNEEIFDVEWDYVKREKVENAYEDFWACLPEDLAEILDLMLL